MFLFIYLSYTIYVTILQYWFFISGYIILSFINSIFIFYRKKITLHSSECIYKIKKKLNSMDKL